MAVWSHAEQADVEDDVVQLSGVRLGGLSSSRPPSLAGISWTRSGFSASGAEQVKGLLGVPVSIISRHETFVAPPELDPRPVDGGVRPSLASLW